jgi:hypothetical protein
VQRQCFVGVGTSPSTAVASFSFSAL